MSIMTRMVKVRESYEYAMRTRRTRKIKNLESEEKLLQQQVKVEKLKAVKAKAKNQRKAVRSFGKGAAEAISKGPNKDNKPYWLKEKTEKPYWLK